MTFDYLKLPVDAYDPSSEDVKRFTDELALGMAPINHPALAKIAATVTSGDLQTVRIQEVISRLFAAARGQQQNHKNTVGKRVLVGLAAPQIGESLRIIIIDTSATKDRKHIGTLECFINPEIVWRSRETEEGREGCFSAGLVWGLVRRPIAVKIQALTPEGVAVERIFEGFTARIAQHEIDHLQGIRFPERITADRKRHWVHTEELAEYPSHIKQWPRLCSRQRWEMVRQGL
jgi:peptide deformylase